MEKQKVAIVGLEWDVVDLIESISDIELTGFIEHAATEEMCDIDFLGSDNDWETIIKNYPTLKAILALDNPEVRARLFKIYGMESFLSLVSPHAYVSKRTLVKPATIIQRGVTIMANATIGYGCKFNVNSTIHHDAQIGNFCTLAPGSLVLGRVLIEDQVYVGAGAIIRQRCQIGAGARIGAGAVVVKDVPAGETVVGIPAKTLYEAISNSKNAVSDK